MRRAIRLGTVACFGLLGLGAAAACASEGEVEQGSPAPPDAGDAQSEGAADVIDAGSEPSPCADSGLCIVNVGIDTRVNVVSIAGSSVTDVWAVGSKRTVLHYDGASWEKVPLPNDSSSDFTLRSVWVGEAADVWLTDGYKLRHSPGWRGASATTWSAVQRTLSLSAISGKGGRVAIATQQGIDPVRVYGGWGADGPVDPIDVLAGSHFIAMATSEEVWGMNYASAGAPSNEIYRAYRSSDAGVSDAGPIWEFEEHDSRFAKNLHGIWAHEDAVWVVGAGGGLRRMTRANVPRRVFEYVESPVTADLLGVYGFGANDVWAVGNDATIVHWDGTAVTKIATPFDTAKEKPRFLAVWGSSPDDVWIGGNGIMLHYDGKATAP